MKKKIVEAEKKEESSKKPNKRKGMSKKIV